MDSSNQFNSFRNSFQRWNENRSQNSQGFNESAKTLFSSWADSFNNTAQDVYARLPLTRQDVEQDQEPPWFSLSRTERLLLFLSFILGSAACFTICVFLFPALAVKPRKFGLLWSMGSLLFVLAFGVLMGPIAYLKHLSSKERIPFTIFFFGTCLLTIYFAAISKSTILTLPCAILELVAVVYYAISYFPFGAAGMRMMSYAGFNTARGALQI
ncbi:protein transport protein sft2 [Zygosaccharomyces mellis]|uniref:Protein transport protein SFT2 n=1 Tax=Zygosaccharomyces mellis TaxID=42258 RepID=A0A4C2EDF9_9SACH|nr:protein transport protein sft2 [Zygosaccharomyces mellis]